MVKLNSKVPTMLVKNEGDVWKNLIKSFRQYEVRILNDYDVYHWAEPRSLFFPRGRKYYIYKTFYIEDRAWGVVPSYSVGKSKQRKLFVE